MKAPLIGLLALAVIAGMGVLFHGDSVASAVPAVYQYSATAQVGTILDEQTSYQGFTIEGVNEPDGIRLKVVQDCHPVNEMIGGNFTYYLSVNGNYYATAYTSFMTPVGIDCSAPLTTHFLQDYWPRELNGGVELLLADGDTVDIILCTPYATSDVEYPQCGSDQQAEVDAIRQQLTGESEATPTPTPSGPVEIVGYEDVVGSLMERNIDPQWNDGARQTITAPEDFTLEEVEVHLNVPYDVEDNLDLEVIADINGTVVSGIVNTSAMVANNSDQWVKFTMDEPLFVNAGDTVTITIHILGFSYDAPHVKLDSAGGYSGGSMLKWNYDPYAGGDWDMHFRVLGTSL